MGKETATPSGAASDVIKATAPLKEVKDDWEKHKIDITEKKIPDEVIELLKGLVDRFEKMEEKVDCRLREMEEKVDMLISSVAKAEADKMSVDESSDDDDEAKTWTPIKATTSNGPFGPATWSWNPIKATTSNSPFDPLVRGRGRGPASLDVGGRFAGGRCGGLGECRFC